jgi:acetyl-CoA carboxylase biotin carboxyl carrier protein
MSAVKVVAEISGSVWKIVVSPGDHVAEEQPLAILESMKMEIPVLAPEAGVVREIRVAEGAPIAEGELIAILEA